MEGVRRGDERDHVWGRIMQGNYIEGSAAKRRVGVGEAGAVFLILWGI